MNKFKLVLSAAALFIATHASAGLFIEPYVGYEGGTIKDSGTSTAAPLPATDFSYAGTIDGTSYGGKLGVSFLDLTMGADYMGGNLTTRINGASQSNTTSNLGAFVRIGLPFVALSATYFFNSAFKNSNGEIDGTAFKGGISFTGLPFIALNLDVVSYSLPKVSSNVAGLTFSNWSASATTVIVSISLPLSF